MLPINSRLEPPNRAIQWSVGSLSSEMRLDGHSATQTKPERTQVMIIQFHFTAFFSYPLGAGVKLRVVLQPTTTTTTRAEQNDRPRLHCTPRTHTHAHLLIIVHTQTDSREGSHTRILPAAKSRPLAHLLMASAIMLNALRSGSLCSTVCRPFIS